MSDSMTGSEIRPEPSPHEGNIVLGLCWGLTLSTPFWIVIITIIVRIVRN